MHKNKVFITRKLPQTPALDYLQTIATISIHPGPGPPSPSILRQSVTGCSGILTMLSDRITKEVIAAAGPSLKIISNYAVGFNNIDVTYATQKGILVAHTPDVLTETTADLTWALLLAVARRVVEADTLVRSERWTGWEPTFMLGTDLQHKTLGIIGLGRLGLAVAKRASAFNMKVIYYSRTRKHNYESQFHFQYKPLPDLLRESDFISVHVPLTAETEGLIGTEEFNLMKPTAIFINTSRGKVIDEDALVIALKSSKIRGAGLDVFRAEPTHNRALFKLSNVILTPHIGSATLETRIQMAELAITNLIYGLTGKYDKIKLVNPTVLQSL
ncbi:MAG: 2-hydroxyacid dehydrogenase [Candidatus Helarchaeota archaeon]